MFQIRFSKKNAMITVIAGSVILILGSLGMKCLFLTFFHIPCPGCGMSRACAALLQLKIKEAFAYYPCIAFMPLFYLYFWQDGAVFRNKKVNAFVLIIAAILFMLCYILSNFII